MRTILSMFAAALVGLSLAGCVSAKAEDGSVQMRFTTFADAAEVVNLEERVVAVEASVVQVRADLTGQIETASAAFLRALSEGKTAAEAQAAAQAAATAQAAVTAEEAKRVAAGAAQAYDDNRIIGRLGIEEILGILGITATGGVALNRYRNRTRKDALKTVAPKPAA